MVPCPRELPDNRLENIVLSGVRGLQADLSPGCAEAPPRYVATLKDRQQRLHQLLGCANELLRRLELQSAMSRPAMDTCPAVADYLRVHFRFNEAESFVALFLDAQHRLLGAEELFRGTLTQTSVYPREVVKRALAHNAAALFVAHNHPSGVAEPSRADEFLTASLKSALALVDVRLLDHFVVGGGTVVSFAERGLL